VGSLGGPSPKSGSGVEKVRTYRTIMVFIIPTEIGFDIKPFQHEKKTVEITT